MESRARPLDIPRSPKRLCNNCSHCDAASTLAHGSPSTATLADSTPADDLSTHSPASTAAFPDDHFSDSDHSDLGGESESGVAGPDSPAPSSTRRHAPECVAGMPGPVTVCLCEQKLSEEAKRVVPFLFFYNYSNQEKMLIPHGGFKRAFLAVRVLVLDP